jgi:hypothetical protein
MSVENSEAIERCVGGADPGVSRVKLTSAGVVVEANGTGKAPGYGEHLYEVLSEAAWQFNEMIYSIHVFTSPEDRFVVKATLREIPSTKSFNMSTSITGANDIYCRFTRFDLDVLTLAEPGFEFVSQFIIDPDFPIKAEPHVHYREVEIQGHQVQINDTPRRRGDHYEILLQSDEIGP